MGSDYQLHGGRRTDVAAVANVLTCQGIPISEPLLFAASGGIGAGYAVREFPRAGQAAVELGFRGRWRDPRGWVKSTLDRLGVGYAAHTGGRRGAAKRLTTELAGGNPALVLLNERFAVAYDEVDGEVFVDDGHAVPLIVERQTFDAVRDQVDSVRNLLVTVSPGELADFPAAVRAGLAGCANQGMEAWGVWAKHLIDSRDPKGWPTVFSGRPERPSLVGALLVVWENVSPQGPFGGHLRDLFAEGLDEASTLLELPELTDQTEDWRAIADLWNQLAEAAASKDIPEFGWLRQLTAAVSAGDPSDENTVEAAAELQRLRAHYDTEAPFTEDQVGALFSDLAERLKEIWAAETKSLEELAAALSG